MTRASVIEPRDTPDERAELEAALGGRSVRSTTRRRNPAPDSTHERHRAHSRAVPAWLVRRSAATLLLLMGTKDIGTQFWRRLRGESPVHKYICFTDLPTQRPSKNDAGGRLHCRCCARNVPRTIIQDSSQHHRHCCNRHHHDRSGYVCGNYSVTGEDLTRIIPSLTTKGPCSRP